MLRKVCNPLFESSLNLSYNKIKHLRITVGGEYVYGLSRFLGVIGHGIQPIIYRMLKRINSFNLFRAIIWVNVSQNTSPWTRFKLITSSPSSISPLLTRD